MYPKLLVLMKAHMQCQMEALQNPRAIVGVLYPTSDNSLLSLVRPSGLLAMNGPRTALLGPKPRDRRRVGKEIVFNRTS